MGWLSKNLSFRNKAPGTPRGENGGSPTRHRACTPTNEEQRTNTPAHSQSQSVPGHFHMSSPPGGGLLSARSREMRDPACAGSSCDSTTHAKLTAAEIKEGDLRARLYAGSSPSTPKPSENVAGFAPDRHVHVVRVLRTHHPGGGSAQLSISEGELVLVTNVGQRGWFFGHVLCVSLDTGVPCEMRAPGGWFPGAPQHPRSSAVAAHSQSSATRAASARLWC